MKEKMSNIWQSMSITKKIGTFTGMVFLIIALSVLFDIWVVKFSLLDFNRILEDNARSSVLVDAMEEEAQLFETYVRNPTDERATKMEEAFARTKAAIDGLPFDYKLIGETRYAKTWSIRNSYELYEIRRDDVLKMGEDRLDYINKLYDVYDMQTYLQGYTKTLMRYTMEAGSQTYQRMFPGLILVPFAVLAFSSLLLWTMVMLARVMNRTIIIPVMELVKMSKRVADNDFFVADVAVQNKDELGELVRAFNKMKYATGEYILALEEKRKTLDLLHAEELEKVNVEKRLETMKLDLLKSQINPHFLFNTLNVIGGMAMLEGAETTEKMIKALSSLFRYNLKTPDVEVPLSKELKVVRDYLYLQQMRFGNRVSFEIDCQADEESVVVPTFTFQPLVENAIIHGLSPKEEGGRIRIRIWERGKLLHITIADTGVGMTAEQLESLRSGLSQENHTHSGIGLGNIYNRLASMYQGSSIAIYSREQVGTVIVMEIPQKG
ncbi:MAG: sensor histidine kinase [Lachnospiraceae bacterium]|nr:sensor histidine kinase [Lachnospiraceae bacterium]